MPGKIKESGGQELTIGAIAAGDRFQRVSTELKGFTPAYFFAMRQDALDLTNNNTWYDIPFNMAAILKQGFTHDNTSSSEQITVSATGLYWIYYRVCTYYVGRSGNFIARVLDDGTEIDGSMTSCVRYYQGVAYHEFIAQITAGSVIELQAGGTVAGMDVQYLDATGLGANAGAAHIAMVRIA